MSSVEAAKIPQLKDRINKILYFTDFGFFDPLSERLFASLEKYSWLLKNMLRCHTLLEKMGDETQAANIEVSKSQLDQLFGIIAKVRRSICGDENLNDLAESKTEGEKSLEMTDTSNTLQKEDQALVQELKNGWLKELLSIQGNFDKKFGSTLQLEEEYHSILKLVKLSKESMLLHKKEKNLTPMVVLEVLKQKPTLSAAADLVKKFESLGMVFADYKKDIMNMID